MTGSSDTARAARTILEGLAFGESPRWHRGELWFCNWGTGEIVATTADGAMRIAARVPTTLSYSIDWLPDGALLVVSGQERLILRQQADGGFVTHADLTAISPRGWNEIVVDGRGNIYVNGGGPALPEGQFFGGGTIALITPDGAVREVAGDIAFPNGMAVSADNKTLICADSFNRALLAFDIAADGTLSGRRIWADLGQGAPDGICLDADGAVWYGDVPNRHCRRVAEGGSILDTVAMDRGCFACMLGGDDRKTLFILAAEFKGFDFMFSPDRTGLLSAVRAPAKGSGFPAA